MQSTITILMIDAGVWIVWTLCTGIAGPRLPSRWLDSRWLVTALKPRAIEMRMYERSRIRRWKDRLPEAGALFGGISKRIMPSMDRTGLAVLARETRRAEIVHWANVAALPLFAIWNPWQLMMVMGLYAAAANLPFIAIQRFNRGRIRTD